MVFFVQLNKESVKTFQGIYKKKTGKNLDEKEAQEIGSKVFDLFMAIYDPLEEKETYENRI